MRPCGCAGKAGQHRKSCREYRGYHGYTEPSTEPSDPMPESRIRSVPMPRPDVLSKAPTCLDELLPRLEAQSELLSRASQNAASMAVYVRRVLRENGRAVR